MSSPFDPDIICHVEKRWDYDATHVWFLQRKHCAQYEDGGFTWIPYNEGQILPEPTLKIPTYLFAALAAATTEYLPPSKATDRHLEDSIKVRDRLLTLVEKH